MNVQPTVNKIDSIFDRYTKPESPGCALAVIKDSKIMYQQGYGLANLEHKVPILPTTVFNIGSMAKQFTAFAVALLEDQGKLSFDDDIRKYLPEMHDFGQTVTIRHLIHHMSGLRGSFPELLALAEWRDTDTTTTRDVYWLLKAQRGLNFRPGDEFQYVNTNYVLLALICEQVSRQSFATFCQERIFSPLGMTRSVINDSIVKMIPGRALGYYDDEQGSWLNAPLTDSVVGPTNVYTTVEDLAKWDENFYTGQVGGRAVIEQMVQQSTLNDGTELDYAFGLMVGPAHQHRGWKVVEHGGGQGGYGSWMVRFPELHLSVVVLFNHFLWGMQNYALKVADLILEKKAASRLVVGPQEGLKVAATPVELSAEQLEKKAGIYFNTRRASLREISYAEDRLKYQGLDLVPLSENIFFFKEEPQIRVEFIPTKDDTVARMKTITSSGEYGYDRVETVPPTPDELAQYAGRYYSPELDIYWTIDVRNAHLIAKRRKYIDSKLMPLFTDTFKDDWEPLMEYPSTYLVIFEHDDGGTITGLSVSGTRVRHLRFIKQGL